MAGGSGERFWPVSTREHPKQFLNLADPTQNLLQQAVSRAEKLVGTENTGISTTTILQEKSAQACPQLPSQNVLAEPAKRNTAGALVWLAANLIAKYPTDWATTTVAVLTADQQITPQSEFESTISKALQTTEDHGSIVTIGIRPDRPETGFGYIQVGKQEDLAFQVDEFKEKPSLPTAEKYLASGNYLWNAGMFFYTLATFMAELEQAQPEMARITRNIAAHLANNQQSQAIESFESLPSISIDFALMENAKKVHVVEATFEWDDLGSWDAIARSYPQDENKNVAVGSAELIDSAGSIIYNTQPDKTINLLGTNDIVVVTTAENILVCPKNRVQDVKKFIKKG